MKEYIIDDDFLKDETNLSDVAKGYLHELIRCENCAHNGNPLMCPLYRISPPSNGYCYCAERREE